MEDLIKESIIASEEEFYNKDFYFSYSSLNKLMWNPAVFYQMYVLGLKEESTSPSLIAGKVIHALLLNKEVFDEMFIISPSKLPSENTKLVVDRVFAHYKELSSNGDSRTELKDYSDAILDVLVDINLHQSLKTDSQRLDKIISEDTISYWSFLKQKGNKELIDQQLYDYCIQAADILKQNPEINNIMGLNVSEFDNIEVFNEIELSKKLDNYSFGLKGIIDNLVINHDEKKIYINDLKTTSKDLKDFPESVEYYSYWMQSTIYLILVFFKYEELLKQGYNISFNFVVIDKTFMTYCFSVSEQTQQIWFDRFTNEILLAANYHYTNKKYELPYKFCTKQVIL